MPMELNWVVLQRQRYIVGLDKQGDIRAIAQNKGDLHGPQGIDDPTGQRWYGIALQTNSIETPNSLLNTYTAYGELPDFSTLRACLEEDL